MPKATQDTGGIAAAGTWRDPTAPQRWGCQGTCFLSRGSGAT